MRATDSRVSPSPSSFLSSFLSSLACPLWEEEGEILDLGNHFSPRKPVLSALLGYWDPWGALIPLQALV